jgi:hypothetical protein
VSDVKDETRALLDRLPENCSFEDVQYHLHVAVKIRRGLARAAADGATSQEEAERRLGRWLSR